MATEAHCAYCFESLLASLEKRPALSLNEVESLWAKFKGSDTGDNLAEASDELRSPAMNRLLAPSPASTSSSSVSSTSASTPLSTEESSKSSSRSSLSSSIKKTEHEEFPLFVTWNTISRSGHKNLRGCIGTFEAQALDDGLRSYALTSAFEDTRFNPISLREAPSLECGVTLLTDFLPASDPMAWEIGKHGLRISFTYNGRRYGSTYLPDVAREQGWTKEETLVSLMRKAGWNGRKDEWRKVSDLNVVTYQGDRVVLGYSAWQEWRDWVDGSNEGR
ncbi:hypothetical protein EJ05DRAFT_476383 [Pseudovirgaria hyperparasitica]|uniref:AMMECR1 domain-containing protein n=1 Tax=Pseudovirgaria hyperparasitica TaxID=470096 RepID=A0A6A6W680_9PEZI|nr:uncharacterized protein EJ05DRAFT_476383 [Pseudovirgaria hyperparasitica]KAF2758123.1 hypothetical protein EJ05DRAFT_476383 [Pseudovirgaria hyperparasitica]